jgi:hypothetical protein
MTIATKVPRSHSPPPAIAGKNAEQKFKSQEALAAH